MSLHTLKGWLKTPSKSGAEVVMPNSLPQSLPAGQWSAPERLLALQESHGLRGEALHAWCRDKGLFEHQLTAWREAFVSTPAPETAQERRESKAELKALQGKHEVLQRELRRKERALAEAAALLVLQKNSRRCSGTRTDDLHPTAPNPAHADSRRLYGRREAGAGLRPGRSVSTHRAALAAP